MEILIITPPAGPRNPDLVGQLGSLAGHQVVEIEAAMMSAYPEGFDRERADALQERPHTPGELGCATSHQRAYQHILSRSDPWTVVLEDDAVITDLERFTELLNEISETAPSAEGTVITLYSPGAIVRRGDRSSFPECIFEPAYALAYVVSQVAAQRLIDANEDLTFTADWPRGSGVLFRTGDIGIIEHGLASNQSLIGQRTIGTWWRGSRRHRLSRAAVFFRRLQLYTFIDYVRHRHHFSSAQQYYRFMLRHRIRHHVGRVVGQVVGHRHPRLRPTIRVIPWPSAQPWR